MRSVIFLALISVGQAQCDGNIIAVANPNGGTVVAPSAFATNDCQWSVQTDGNHFVEINITEFLVDSTPPFCQDVPGFPLVDDNTNQQFACAQVNPFCSEPVVLELCPETCSLCDSCTYNYISMIGTDGVEYFRDCQTIGVPIVISTQVSNVIIKSSRKFLTNSRKEFATSQDRFSFTYRPIPKANYTRQSTLCSGTVTLTADNGTFNDGSLPNAPYQANADCAWVISAPAGKFVELTFASFALQNPSQYDLYSSQKRCLNDVVSIVDGSSTSDTASLMGQYCGVDIPPVTLSSGQNLTVLFKADASVERFGFTANYRFVDVGSTPPLRCTNTTVYNGTEGEANVVSGLNDMTCAWTIIPPSGKYVRIEYVAHSLTPFQPDCPEDEITIYQGATMLQKSCDQYLPPPVTSTLNGTDGALLITFKTTVRTLEYFHFKWTFVDVPLSSPGLCSGNKVITAGLNDTGRISDGTVYGVPYNSNMLCKWTINSPNGTLIHLDYEHFSLEPAIGCIYDNITVFSGDGTFLLQKACGTTIPVHVQSTTNQLVVVFYSDIQLNLDGFSAIWSVVPAASFVPSCGGIEFIDAGAIPTGNITSVSTYSSIGNCSWLITAPVGQYIQLEVLSLNLYPRELGYEICYSESLSAWDGNSTSSYMLFKNCGTEEVPVQVSTGNTVLVTYAAAMQVRQGGFMLQYSTVSVPGTTTDRFCGGVQNYPINPDDENGTLVNYVRGSLYRPDARCEFIITAPAGKYVQITWDYFGLQDPDYFGRCGDYITVRDGDINGRELQRSCGFYTPLPATSTQRQLTVLFVANSFIQSYGFVARWEIVDRPGGITDCSGNRTIYQKPVVGVLTDGSNGFGYLNNAYCSWLLTAPPGLGVSIKFTRLALQTATNNVCRDYVQVTDGKSPRARLCGNLSQSMLDASSFVSVSDHVLVEFSSDESNAGAGFAISYSFVARPVADQTYSNRVEMVVAVVLLSFFGVVLLCCVFVWYKRRQAAKAVEHIDLNRGQDLRKRTISEPAAAPPTAAANADTTEVETTGPQPID